MSGFVSWISTYGGMIAWAMQLVWWLVTGVAIIWAAWNFQRYVETRMGTLKAEGGVGTFDTAADEKGKADEAVDKAKRDAKKVDVDEFVE
jgi:hypothetical protein